MTRKQDVCNESTNTASPVPVSRNLIVNAPTLLDGMGELWRLCRAHARANGVCGVSVTRRSRTDPTMIAVLPDLSVEAGVTATEYLR